MVREVDDEGVNDVLEGECVVEVGVDTSTSSPSSSIWNAIGMMSADLKNVDLSLVRDAIEKICSRTDMKTSDIEKHAVLQCRQKEYAHYEWSLLAGRLQIHFQRQHIPKTFSESTKAMKEILHPWYYDYVMANAEVLDKMIVEERDATFDIFAADTLISSYLARIVMDDDTWICETPQFMYLRIAVFLWFEPIHQSTQPTSSASSTSSAQSKSLSKSKSKFATIGGQGCNARIEEVYTDLSKGNYSHASPTLFNAGMLKHQLASCFTKTIDDSIDSISNQWRDVAYISKDSGGLGLDFSSLRHSEISRNGKTNGVVPWIRITESILTTVNQCFDPNTTVYSIDGPIKISDVSAGDMILRQDGTFGSVAKQIRYDIPEGDCDGDAKEIMTATSTGFVTVSGSHPMYAIKFPVKLATPDDICDVLNGGTVVPAYIPVREMDERTYIATPIPVYEKDIDFITVRDCTFYGLVLCDVACYYDEERDDTQSKTKRTPGTYPICNYNTIESGAMDVLFEDEDGVTAEVVEFVRDYLDSYGVGYTYLRDTFCGTSTFTIDTYSRNFKFSKNMFVKRDSEGNPGIVFHPAFLNLPMDKISAIYKGLTMYKSESDMPCGLNFRESLRYILIRLGMTMNPKRNAGGTNSFFYGGMLWSRVEVIQAAPARSGFVVDLEMDRVKGEDEETFSNYVTSLGIAHNGGRRKGSGTGFLCDWHLDIEGFISLKNPENPEDLRALGMTFAVNIHDLFMERCEKDEDWTLICPNKTGGLVEKWGKEFEASYLELEQKCRDGKIRAFKVVKARDLLIKIILSSMRTASPFVLNIDAANRKSNQQHLGTTRLSNLCMEILLYSDRDNIGSCILGAANLSRCIIDKKFNYQELDRITRALTRNLNQVIDRNFYHKQVPQIEYTNLRNRPEGIGYMGLADVFALLDLTWDSLEAREINVMISETMYYAAITESCLLAQQFGPYETFEGSPTSQGLLQFDLWKKEALEKELRSLDRVDETTVGDVVDTIAATESLRFGSTRYDWDTVRKDVVQFGLRNSLLIALMPTATSAHILGTNESFEPYTQHIFTRTILAGQYVVTNKHLVNDLQELGLWNTAVARNVWENEGSIQNIPEFFYLTDLAKERLRYLKRKYLTVYELPQKLLQNMCIDRASYVCQTQSFNCWMKDANVSKLIAYFFHGWKNGLKTGIYYLRQPAKKNPVNHALKNIRVANNRSLVKKEYECVSCSV